MIIEGFVKFLNMLRCANRPDVRRTKPYVLTPGRTPTPCIFSFLLRQRINTSIKDIWLFQNNLDLTHFYQYSVFQTFYKFGLLKQRMNINLFIMNNFLTKKSYIYKASGFDLV